MEVHERGTKLGIYTVCLCWGSTGPLYAGYMLAGGHSWRLYFYVEIAFAGALLLLAFFFVEETMYLRDSSSSIANLSQKRFEVKDNPVEHLEVSRPAMPVRRSFLQSLKPWSWINRREAFFLTAARSFTYFLVPSVLWVVATYGIYIGLGALVFNYTFPIKIGTLTKMLVGSVMAADFAC